MILLRREKPLQPVPLERKLGVSVATSSLGTKACLSAGKAAEVSPCSSLYSGEQGDVGRDVGYLHGVRAPVLLKELTVTGPLGWVPPPGSREEAGGHRR